MRVLAIGAHPDDLENLCGGTLARFADEGHDVIMCHALNGNLGHLEIPRPELREIRRKEAQAAAAVIGAESITLDIDDLDIYIERDHKMRMVEAIRKARPDIIISHAYEDYMPDHTVTARLAFDASFIGTLPQLETESPAHMKITPFYHMDTMAGVNFIPNEYVDITRYMNARIEMLKCHQSQLKWLADHDNIDVVEFTTIAARYRGMQAGVKYAEGFRLALVWGRGVTERLLP